MQSKHIYLLVFRLSDVEPSVMLPEPMRGTEFLLAARTRSFTLLDVFHTWRIQVFFLKCTIEPLGIIAIDTKQMQSSV